MRIQVLTSTYTYSRNKRWGYPAKTVTIVIVHTHRLYTIGHGHRAQDALLESLKLYEIDILVDIRSRPGSSQPAYFEGTRLRSALEQLDITYHWAGRQLGELRKPNPDSPHSALRNPRLRAFADYMLSNDFHRAAAQLLKLIYHSTSVIFDAVPDPQASHRSLVADYLVLKGITVLHITAAGVIEHHLRPEARKESAELIYDHAVAVSD